MWDVSRIEQREDGTVRIYAEIDGIKQRLPSGEELNLVVSIPPEALYYRALLYPELAPDPLNISSSEREALVEAILREHHVRMHGRPEPLPPGAGKREVLGGMTPGIAIKMPPQERGKLRQALDALQSHRLKGK